MRKIGLESPDFADALMLTFDQKDLPKGSKSYTPNFREFAQK